MVTTWPKPGTFFERREIYVAIGPHRFIVTFETEEEWNMYLNEAANSICPFRPDEMFGAIVHKVTN